jgi:hypothetical protein
MYILNAVAVRADRAMPGRLYNKCQKFFPHYPETRFLKKAGFPDLSGKDFYHIQLH